MNLMDPRHQLRPMNPIQPLNHLLPPSPMAGPFDADAHFKLIRERQEAQTFQQQAQVRNPYLDSYLDRKKNGLY